MYTQCKKQQQPCNRYCNNEAYEGLEAVRLQIIYRFFTDVLSNPIYMVQNINVIQFTKSVLKFININLLPSLLY